MTYFVGQFSGFDAKVNLVYKICDNSCIFFRCNLLTDKPANASNNSTSSVVYEQVK